MPLAKKNKGGGGNKRYFLLGFSFTGIFDPVARYLVHESNR